MVKGPLWGTCNVGTYCFVYFVGGAGCTAYDVVVNSTFLEKMQKSEVFRAFFLSVTLEGIEDKYNQTLNRGLYDRSCLY